MKKKLMILLVAALFLTMMFSTGCKKAFDITGIWTMTFNWNAAANNSRIPDMPVSDISGAQAAGVTTLTFTGDKKAGTFSSTAGYTGTYTVDGKNVKWVYTSGTTYTGTSSDDKNMAGTMISAYGGNGTWTATR